MPLRLIGIIILVVFVAVLTGFNLGNTCSLWFFHTFTGVPVFAAVIGAFLLGVIVTLPFTFGKKKMQKKLEKAKEELEAKEREVVRHVESVKENIEEKNARKENSSIQQDDVKKDDESIPDKKKRETTKTKSVKTKK